MDKPAGRLYGVDMLRGLAILFVLMNHVNMRLLIGKIPYGQGLPKQVLSSLVWNGQYGVQIFFAVSGFLITSTSLRRWGSPSGVKIGEFYRLRFARIAPLLLLLLAILSLLHFTGSKWFFVKPQTGGLGNALLAALTFRVNVLEAWHGYLPPNWDILWSLSVEEAFYLFFPLACFALGRGRGQRLVVLLIGFVCAGPFARTIWSAHNEVWHEYSYLGGMDAIAMGCLTALWLPRFRGVAMLRAAGLGLMAFVLCFSLTARHWGLERTGLDMTLVGLGTCLVIASVAKSDVRGLGPLTWIGSRSYEVYLTHMFVVIGCFTLFLSLGKPAGWAPALFLVSILCAGVLGELTARFYSDPMNRYLRGITIRTGLRETRAPATASSSR